MFNVLDAAYDVYLKVNSAQYRLQSNAYKINRYIGKRANWYYQHKYSLRTQQNCEMDKGIIAQHVGNLKTQFAKFNKMLEALGHDIVADMQQDVTSANQSLKAARNALANLQEPDYEEEPDFITHWDQYLNPKQWTRENAKWLASTGKIK